MIKAGYKSNQPTTLKGYASESSTDADPPETFSLDEDDLKEIKSWKVGDTYNLSMTVKLVSQREDSLDKGMMRATFEIQDVTVDDGTEGDGGDSGDN